ncbi:MAG: hypothetical protein MRY74_16965, partial [Neomegalonema sp.]|nr:hypothetical protein [Neomegalonema sp.]
MLRQLSRFVTMVAAAIIAVGILVSLLLFDRFIVSEAPEGKALKTLTIRIDEVERKDGLKQVLIGRKELMHPPGALSAVERHVRITQRDGEWHLGNASTSRRLFLIFEDRKTGKRFETAARRMPLEVGDRIERFEGAVEIYDVKRSNGRAETVDLAVAQRAGLRGFSKRLSYYRLSLSPSHRGLVAPMVKGPDGALIRAEGKRLPAGWVGKCRERSPFSETVSRFTQWSVGLIARNEWARKLVGATSEQTALRFGGVLSCEGGVETPRIAITDLAPGGIQISARDGVLFWATDDAAAFATVKRKAAAGFAPPAAALTPGGEGCKAIERFSDIEWPLQLDGKSAGPDRGCVAAPSGWTGQLSRVIIGRTQYKVSVSGDKGVLTLTADTNRPVFFDSAIEVDPKDLPKGVAAVATPVSTKGDAPGPLRFLLTKTPLPVIALMGVALFGVLYFLFDSRVEPGAATMRSGARVQRRVLAAGLGALSFLVALVGVYYLRPGLIRLTTLGLVPTPEASPPYAAAELWILNLGLASLAALFAARGSWRAYAYWGAVMLIVGAGMVNFAQLAAGADNTRYSDEYSKFVLAATMAAPALTFAWLVPLSKVRWLIGVFLTPPAGQRPTRADAAQQGLRLSWRVGFELALLGAVAVCFAAAGFFALFGIGLHLGLPTLPMFAGESATALYSAAALFGIIGVGV